MLVKADTSHKISPRGAAGARGWHGFSFNFIGNDVLYHGEQVVAVYSVNSAYPVG